RTASWPRRRDSIRSQPAPYVVVIGSGVSVLIEVALVEAGHVVLDGENPVPILPRSPFRRRFGLVERHGAVDQPVRGADEPAQSLAVAFPKLPVPFVEIELMGDRHREFDRVSRIGTG